MSTENKQIIAGLIMVVLLFGLLLFVHSRSAIQPKQSSFVLYATFSKADELMLKSDVRLAGIRVGQISKKELFKGHLVRVELSFDKPVELSTDTSVIVETDGLLGTKHLELMPGGEDDLLKSGDNILYIQDGLILNELLEKVNGFMREKKDVSETTVETELNDEEGI